MSKEQWLELLKDIGERALWTFLQGFLVTFTATGEFTKTAIIAACMAGISAVKTFLVDYIQKKLNTEKSQEESESTEGEEGKQ